MSAQFLKIASLEFAYTLHPYKRAFDSPLEENRSLGIDVVNNGATKNACHHCITSVTPMLNVRLLFKLV